MPDSLGGFTQKEFGDVVGIGQARVSGLFSRGVLTKEMTLPAAIAAYCAHLREQAAGRAAEGGLDLATERARLAKAQRQRIELQSHRVRRENVPFVVLEQVISRTGRKVAEILSSIPDAIERRHTELSPDDLALIAEECKNASNAAASMKLTDVVDAPEQPDTSTDTAPEGCATEPHEAKTGEAR